ncbi:MAG: DUF2752 domain-containing protein [Clostridiales bacterium]|nr:DUF2752 domain-containing protein [Clostridiales bacterium]
MTAPDRKESLDRLLCPALLLTLLLFGLGALIYTRYFSHIPIARCFFFESWGIYCPGCGATRALLYLLQGQVLLSLRCNAGVFYFLVGTVVYLLSHGLARLTGRRWGIPFRTRYLLIGFGILLANSLVWNTLSHGFGIWM